MPINANYGELNAPTPYYEFPYSLKKKVEEAFELWEYSCIRRKRIEENTKYSEIFGSPAKHVRAIEFQIAVERRCYNYYKSKEKELNDWLYKF